MISIPSLPRTLMLSDNIDRLEYNIRSIKSTVASCANSGTGPFTRALLSTQLGDLIRDIDSSELGLFTVTASSTAVAHDKETRNQAGVEISRAEFHGATPLRRQVGRREPKDVQPEVYAQAALKILERYQEIRPMPRAYKQVTAILDQLELSDERIRSITQRLEQTQTTEAKSLKSVAEKEQQRIDQLLDQIVALRKHKETLLEQKPREEPMPGPSKHPDPVDPEEERFWSTPGTSTKPLRFTDNLLLDEEAEFGDLSITSSISSPVPLGRFAKTFPEPSAPDVSESPSKEQSIEESEEPVISQSGKEQVAAPEPDTPKTIDTPRKEKRVRISMDVERAVARIWSTAGELIMPGHLFNTTNNLPPVAKATISHLQSLSNLTPTVASPTHSVSTMSKGNAPPTAQQILTAHLLLALLSSDTLSLPLNKVKELLAAKASTSGSAAMVSGHPKALYGCVAKRLLKIERGAGEQVVKFDI